MIGEFTPWHARHFVRCGKAATVQTALRSIFYGMKSIAAGRNLVQGGLPRL